MVSQAELRSNRIEIWSANELVSDPVGEPTLIETTDDQVNDFAISDDGRWIAVASSEGQIRLWDAQDPRGSSISLPDSKHKYSDLMFVPGDHWLAAINGLGLITTWSIQAPGNYLSPCLNPTLFTR